MPSSAEASSAQLASDLDAAFARLMPPSDRGATT
jgi:hypothetical protein